MLSFFKKKRDRKSALTPFWRSIGQVGERWQRKWADFMNKRTQKLGVRIQWVLFFAFSFCFGLVCICCIVVGFRRHSANIKVDGLSLPAYVISPKDREVSKDFKLPELQHLQELARYADSLRGCGSPAFDSIIRNNPDFKANLDELKKILQTYKLR